MDPLYERYASTHAGAEELGSLHVVLARDLLPLLPDRGARCLDLGCGQGGLVAYLRQHGYDNAFGVDISPEQVAVARSLGRDYVAEGDVLATLAESSESWEVLTAFDFFEHLDRQHVVDTLIAARRTLPPGGRLIARVPNAAGPLYGAIQYGDFTHRSHFTQRSLRQLTQVAGFEEVIVLERARRRECSAQVDLVRLRRAPPGCHGRRDRTGPRAPGHEQHHGGVRCLASLECRGAMEACREDPGIRHGVPPDDESWGASTVAGQPGARVGRRPRTGRHLT